MSNKESSITEKIYKGLFEIKTNGKDPRYILIPINLKLELERACFQSGRQPFAEDIDKFCGVLILYCINLNEIEVV